MRTKRILGILIIIALIFNSCKKPKDGEPGPAGKDGVANISQTITTPLSSSDWVSAGTGMWTHTISVSALTDSYSTAVMVYAYIFPNYFALPCSGLLTSSDHFNYSFQDGSVKIYYSNSTAPTTTLQFRVVVIPPAMQTQNDDIDLKNYEEVKKRFNLK
jgi:hypothetical protein